MTLLRWIELLVSIFAGWLIAHQFLGQPPTASQIWLTFMLAGAAGIGISELFRFFEKLDNEDFND